MFVFASLLTLGCWLLITHAQFEAERFVDSLLGIGTAGGSKNKNEGKMLADRLDNMRKERDARSKAKKAQPKKTPVTAGPPSPQEEEESSLSESFEYDDSGVVELTGAGTSSGGGASRRGNPRAPKKKKKRKNKK